MDINKQDSFKLYGKCQNEDLYKRKKDLISFLDINKPDLAQHIFSLNCNYLGVPLKFFSKSQSFIEDLKLLLPQEWLLNSNNPTSIYLFSPEEFDFDINEWCNEISQNCFRTINDSSETFIQRDFVALIKDEIILVSEEKISDGFYNFLRSHLSNKVIQFNKVIFHSSCVVGNDNKARFFIGHSGAGKTTISSLSNGRKILGDDMNLCFIKDNMLYASPAAIGGTFLPDVDYNECFEVEGFYWLEKAQDNSIENLSKIQAKSKIIASFANLFWEDLSKEEINFFTNFSTIILNNVSVKKLKFNKTSDFWRLLENE